MRYVVHLTEAEFEEMIDRVIEKRLSGMEKILKSLDEEKDNELLKIKDVAHRMKVTDRTIRTWVNQKKLKCYWIGDRQYFRLKDIFDSMHSNF